MSRLIQVGLLFISLMVGIQGQTPISCKINLDKTIVPRHGFFNEQEVWDGWYTVTVDSKLFSDCGTLKRGICRYVSSQKYGCDKSWYTSNTEVGDLYKRKFSNGLICARGESQYHGNLEPGMRLIQDFLEEQARGLEKGYDFNEWSQEIPCFKRRQELSPRAIANAILMIFGTAFCFLIFRYILEVLKLQKNSCCMVWGWFLWCHHCSGCCCTYEEEWDKLHSGLTIQKQWFKMEMNYYASLRPSARYKLSPRKVKLCLSNPWCCEAYNRPILKLERWFRARSMMLSKRDKYGRDADCYEILALLWAINQRDIVEKLSSVSKNDYWVRAERDVRAGRKTWLAVEEELWKIECQIRTQREKKKEEEMAKKICRRSYFFPPFLCFSRDSRQVCAERCCGRSSDSATSSSRAPSMAPSAGKEEEAC